MEGLRSGGLLGVVACAAACTSMTGEVPEPVPEALEVEGLKNAASFADIGEEVALAQALFTEAGKVILHARCVNCHPTGNRPLQTDAQHLHQPPVVRGEDGHGAVGMKCQTCHHGENVDLGAHSVPGHEHWHLAPESMGWVGRSLGEICEQVKDPARNGNRTVAEVVEHMALDSLVGWAWNPGPGREPAPGTQPVFATLVRGWAAAGAHCPP